MEEKLGYKQCQCCHVKKPTKDFIRPARHNAKTLREFKKCNKCSEMGKRPKKKHEVEKGRSSKAGAFRHEEKAFLTTGCCLIWPPGGRGAAGMYVIFH